MRRLLHILLKTLKWTGLTLSTLLLAFTALFWWRSIGHLESRTFVSFVPHPEWKLPPPVKWGTWRETYILAIDGRLWLGSETHAPSGIVDTPVPYQRKPVPAERGAEDFAAMFRPGQRSSSGGVDRVWCFAGAGYRRQCSYLAPETGYPQVEQFDLAIPFWMLAVVFGLWPLGVVVVRVLRKRRRAPHECPACGYDLRATPDPAGPRLPRCPECGRAVVQQASR